MTRVVVVGSGGREAALAAEFAREGAEVIVTPGRDGIPGSTATPPEELDADLFVIGPELPLIDGLANRLRAQGKLVLGPDAREGKKLGGAWIEGSKCEMKHLLKYAGVPTAEFYCYTTIRTGSALDKFFAADPWNGEYVVKTDYLAGGKGAAVHYAVETARADAEVKLNKFEGAEVVVERVLRGRELSVTVLCDGQRGVILPHSRDHKRLYDGDVDPNPMTGGMGAFSPVADVPQQEQFEEDVANILAYLRSHGIDYRGVLYLGYILTANGPMVLEINIRFGDPEAQVVAPRVENLLELCLQAARGKITSEPRISDDAAVCVVLAAKGYPDDPKPDDQIYGIDNAVREGVLVLHAGTKRYGDTEYQTAGGRILSVVGRGSTTAEARINTYRGVAHIGFAGEQYRRSIAEDQ